MNIVKIEIHVIVDVVAIRCIIVIVHVIVQRAAQLQQIGIAGIAIIIQLTMAASGRRCWGRRIGRCVRVTVAVLQRHIRIGIE